MNKLWVSVCCLSLSASVLPAAADASGSDCGSIFGTVRGISGEPMRHVHLLLDLPNGKNRQVQSDAGGQFLFADVKSGTYVVHATIISRDPVGVNVVVIAGHTTVADIVMQPRIITKIIPKAVQPAA